MADTTKKYRTVIGAIQFPPKDAEANGKPVRNITVQQAGFGKFSPRVSATVWPSHSHVQLAKGDVVMLEGPYTSNTTTKDDGTPITYHNISVSRITKLGALDEGNRDVDTVNTTADEVDDEDIPF